MGDNHSHLSLYGKPPLYQLFVSLLIILVVGMFLFLVFYLAGTLIFDGDFVNNAVPVIGTYIQGWEKVNAPSDIPLWKQIIGLTLPIIFSLIILLYFRNKSKKDAEKWMNQSQITNN